MAIDCLTTKGPGPVGWPLAGNVRAWRHHMVARVKVVQWYHDEHGTRHEDDFGGFGPWEEFDPFRFMAGAYAQKEKKVDEEDEDEPPYYGTTITLETSFSYPWRIVWRSRSKPLDETEWEYNEHSDDITSNSSWEIELNVGEGERHEYYDAMILLPVD